MHVNLVTLELLFFAPFSLCHNIDSFTLLRTSSLIIEHTSMRICHDVRKMNGMLMEGASKQHVALHVTCMHLAEVSRVLRNECRPQEV